MNSNKLVVVIPIYKEQLNLFECVAIDQCFKKLHPKYHIVFIKPKSLNTTYYLKRYQPDKVISFGNSFFYDRKGYNKLMLSDVFYSSFQLYTYLLIYQTDAFIFYDNLEEWMGKKYDYIGAPWVTKNSEGEVKIKGVGNGGFSLRNVNQHLKVLKTFSYVVPFSLLLNNINSATSIRGKLNEIVNLILDLTIRNNTHHLFNNYKKNEDGFWCNIAPKKFPWFSIAPAQDAVMFSFELSPDKLYILTNNKLPTGCHAWVRHLNFWRPFLAKEGYKF
jgi:hypothetical protein